jgi:hypothetical protein
MYDYTIFTQLARESKTNEELVEKVKAHGGNATFRNGEVWSGSSDRFGYTAFSAELTNNGFKTTMY